MLTVTIHDADEPTAHITFSGAAMIERFSVDLLFRSQTGLWWDGDTVTLYDKHGMWTYRETTTENNGRTIVARMIERTATIK